MSRTRSPIRVVLDTNVLVSALLLASGRLAWLRRSCQAGVIRPVLAESSARELIRVLAYLGDVLPWCETTAGPIEPAQHQVRDPKDQVFLDLALAVGVPVLVSGDADLLPLKNAMSPLLTLTPVEFQSWLDAQH